MRIPILFEDAAPKISPQRRGLRRGSEGVEQLLNQLAAFALVINISLLSSVLSIESTVNPLYLERGLLLPLLCSPKYLLF
jgi:hypothetical protein